MKNLGRVLLVVAMCVSPLLNSCSDDDDTKEVTCTQVCERLGALCAGPTTGCEAACSAGMTASQKDCIMKAADCSATAACSDSPTPDGSAPQPDMSVPQLDTMVTEFTCCKPLSEGGYAFFKCNDQAAADACNNEQDASGCIRNASRDSECP